MDHAQLIKALGGPHAVHAELEAKGVKISQVGVRAWLLGPRAIPAKYWSPIKEIADAKGVAVSFDALADAVRAA